MRHLFILLVILFAFGANVVRAQNGVDTPSAPFRISSVKSPFALAGNFEGEYRIKSDSIEITILSAAISLRDNCQYKGRRQLAFINVGLATQSPSGSWKVINHARAIPVGETMKPGDNYLAEKMRFSIPRESSLDLANCWLVVEMGELSLDSSEEDRVGYAFAQSDHDIFSPLTVRAAKK